MAIVGPKKKKKEEPDTFDFLTDIDEEIWVKAKKISEKWNMSFREFVELALKKQIAEDEKRVKLLKHFWQEEE